MTDQIVTDEEFETLLWAVSEGADYAIVRTPDRRPWIVWENDRGDFLACSPPEEDDGDTDSHYCDVAQLPLPLTVLSRPDAPAGAGATRKALVKARAEAWSEGHRLGWEHRQDGNYGTDYWDDDTPNPYLAALDLTTPAVLSAVGYADLLAGVDPGECSVCAEADEVLADTTRHAGWAEAMRFAHHAHASETSNGYPSANGVLGSGPDAVIVDGDWLAHVVTSRDALSATVARVEALRVPFDAVPAQRRHSAAAWVSGYEAGLREARAVLHPEKGTDDE